jgi:hypothetical protein
MSSPRSDLPPQTDGLLPWASDVLDWLGQLPGAARPDRWAPALVSRPCEHTLAVAVLASALFYRAEREHNPKVGDFWDALLYCTTCLSVGYAEVHPRTAAGKILGALLMTFGPALTQSMLEGTVPDGERGGGMPQALRRALASFSQPAAT